MAEYADHTGIREALAEHFERSGFAADGGYGARWVRLKFGAFSLAFPNIEARRVVAPYHDIHHVLTGYDTDWPGEMEIAAWEIATGCAHFWMGWLLDLSALGVGAILRPRRTFRAWCRGRGGRNLFREPYADLLTCTVGELRQRIALAPQLPVAPRPGMADRLSFGGFAAAGLGLAAAQIALPLALVVVVVLVVRRVV